MPDTRPAGPALFTPTEAAVLTGLPLKAVHNAIDKKTVMAVPGTRSGRRTRLLDRRALISLALERRLADRLAPELRREVLEALSTSSGHVLSFDGGVVKIDLREPRRALAISLRDLRRARSLVVVDPETMGGNPVFRGTRLPVHMIAEIIAKGETDEDLRASYPRLTAEMIRLAPLYAAAYPLRGRPRQQPWHGIEPILRVRRPLASIGTR